MIQQGGNKMNNSISKETGQIIQSLKFGSANEKIEAITYARRKADDFFLILVFDEGEAKRIFNKTQRMKPFSSEESLKIKEALSDLLSSGKDILACWYAAIALVELGDIKEEILDFLWRSCNQLIEWLDDESSGSALTLAGTRIVVQSETMRALSMFKDSPSVGEKIMECYEAKAPIGKVQSGLRKESIYAFGVIGKEKYKELVEYNAEQGKDEVQYAGKAALELWGEGSYDNIKKLAESKSKKRCFIATAVYGSPDAIEVIILKTFRDSCLEKSRLGSWLNKTYYSISPKVARLLDKSLLLRKFTRIIVISPVAKIVNLILMKRR